jgi:hypothetical protein
MGLYSLITGQDDNAGLDLPSILRRKETLRQEGGRQPVEPAKPSTGALAGASEEDTGPLATYRRQALANQASLMKAYEARQEASKGILEQLAQEKGNKNSEMFFQLAAALGKPTATGSFGETVGNVGEAMASSAAARNKAAQAQRELQAKYALGMLDTDVDIAKAQYEGATDIEKNILSSQDKAAERATKINRPATPAEIADRGLPPKTPAQWVDGKFEVLTPPRVDSLSVDDRVSAAIAAVDAGTATPTQKKLYDRYLQGLPSKAPSGGSGLPAGYTPVSE